LGLASALVGCGSASSIDPGFEPAAPDGSGGAGGAGTSSTTTGGGSGGTSPQPLGPPYPIVLAHGFFGFDDFAGAGFFNYYFEVEEHLANRGELMVFTPEVDPFNSSTYRGAQLADAVREVLDQTGHAKVNIIGHSQGGLDARVVAHDHPEWVAAVVTVGTPHGGSPIVDVALGLVEDPFVDDVLDFFFDTVGKRVWDQIGNETDLGDAIGTFSTQGIVQFNADYPDQPGVFYASVAGRSDRHEGGTACSAATPPFIEQWMSEQDPIDPLLSINEMILDGGLSDPHANDGMVRAIDARWGKFLGCVPADHFDEIGQLFGDGPGLGNDWTHKQFYADLVVYLRDRGY
jgi:triacylglycerol lipase